MCAQKKSSVHRFDFPSEGGLKIHSSRDNRTPVTGLRAARVRVAALLVLQQGRWLPQVTAAGDCHRWLPQVAAAGARTLVFCHLHQTTLVEGQPAHLQLLCTTSPNAWLTHAAKRSWDTCTAIAICGGLRACYSSGSKGRSSAKAARADDDSCTNFDIQKIVHWQTQGKTGNTGNTGSKTFSSLV